MNNKYYYNRIYYIFLHFFYKAFEEICYFSVYEFFYLNISYKNHFWYHHFLLLFYKTYSLFFLLLKKNKLVGEVGFEPTQSKTTDFGAKGRTCTCIPNPSCNVYTTLYY